MKNSTEVLYSALLPIPTFLPPFLLVLFLLFWVVYMVTSSSRVFYYANAIRGVCNMHESFGLINSKTDLEFEG